MVENRLLASLLAATKRGTVIARVCRADDRLLALLVQEKKDSERNPRFQHDFKTLVDVFLQEVVKHDLSLCDTFTNSKGEVFGEENNEFLTDEGTILVEVKPTLEETTSLLNKVVKDQDASRVLAECAHNNVDVDFYCDINLDVILPEKIGVWIDPIDSTSEYIQGRKDDQSALVRSGLPCVTILIGVFNMDTGEPLIGVVKQPFFKFRNGSWSGRLVYGYNIGDHRGINQDFSNIPVNKIVAVSSSEDNHIKETLQNHGYTTVELAGAGYKLLSIISGDVSAYVLSKPTTYFWDVCAGNAILNACGGGVVDFSTLEPIKYRGGVSLQECCNAGGILAFRNSEIKDDLITILNLKTSKT
ncbi:inositol polyphosphate 1-phosphatase [Cimex lectularius]|uniref:Inositol polyphosphate 1-phosphatase n=1 Tax=Cimex lectularius TaxID=79782 RepID=A0A8I6S2L5_CIMLE|nr:inositol polyphosphate 1-phosphatase [Cimex lectularius]